MHNTTHDNVQQTMENTTFERYRHVVTEATNQLRLGLQSQKSWELLVEVVDMLMQCIRDLEGHPLTSEALRVMEKTAFFSGFSTAFFEFIEHCNSLEDRMWIFAGVNGIPGQKLSGLLGRVHERMLLDGLKVVAYALSIGGHAMSLWSHETMGLRLQFQTLIDRKLLAENPNAWMNPKSWMSDEESQRLFEGMNQIISKLVVGAHAYKAFMDHGLSFKTSLSNGHYKFRGKLRHFLFEDVGGLRFTCGSSRENWIVLYVDVVDIQASKVRTVERMRHVGMWNKSMPPEVADAIRDRYQALLLHDDE